MTHEKLVEYINCAPKLSDLREFAFERGGNDDPTLWVIDMENDDYDRACRIEGFDIDECGDIILKVNMELLGDY